MALHRFTRPQVEQMVQRVTDGKALPAEVMRQLVEKTDGVPLYVEEMTKALVESESLTEANGRYEFRGSLSSLAIPATLQDSLTARLDRLGTAKGVAQIGATIGRQFPYALLQAVSQLDHAILQRELARLLAAELLYQRGQAPQATYTFKHALIQDAAYHSLLKRTCQQYHQRIAHALETQFPGTAETQPELLAYHYTEANLSTQAVSYWQQAGQRASQRSAYAEAITHLTKGLELLPTLPDTAERVQQELTLRLTLGVTLTVTKGVAAPEVENAYLRARELCEQLGEPSQLFQVLQGLGGVYVLRAELQKARELGEQLLSLAQQGRDPALLLEAYHMQWCVWLYLGEFTTNQACLEQGLILYDSQKHRSHALQHYGHDPGVCCLAHKSFTLWALGHPDQALQSTDEMLHLARELSHPHSLALALAWAARLHQLRREPQQGHEVAEAAVSLSTAQGFARPLAEGMLMRGWALIEQGQGAEGMTQMRQGLDAYRATAAELWQPYFLALLAGACGKRGQAEEGRHLVDQALAAVGRTGERVWEAELFRLKGEHLRNPECAVPDSEWTSDACFQQALAIAHSQHAKSWELRAATSLARLWQLQDKRKEAYDLLAPVYDWFTEGFDSADLKDAKALLDELS